MNVQMRVHVLRTSVTHLLVHIHQKKIIALGIAGKIGSVNGPLAIIFYLSYHKRKIEDAKHECSRAPWYKKYICIGTGFKILYHGGIIVGLWIAHGVATLALKAADLFLEGVKGIIKVSAYHLIFF